MLLVNQALAHFFVRHRKVDANHHSATANILNLNAVIAHRAALYAQFLQLLYEVLAHEMCILNESFLLEHVENGEGSSTGEMIASEGGAQLPIDRLELWRNEHAAHRETVGNSLCDGDDVGADVKPLMSEELTATAVTARSKASR